MGKTFSYNDQDNAIYYSQCKAKTTREMYVVVVQTFSPGWMWMLRFRATGHALPL